MKTVIFFYMRPIKSSLGCCCHLWLTNSETLIQEILTTMKMNDISWGGGLGGGVEKSCAHFLWSPYRQVRLSARGSKASWRSVLLRYHRVTTLHTPPLHTIDVDVNTNINISNNLTIILRLNHRVKIVLNISLYKRPHKLQPQIINAKILPWTLAKVQNYCYQQHYHLDQTRQYLA